MPRIIVVGGGLAGMAAAAALGDAGFQVDVFEARGFFGGRAASYPLNQLDGEVIDNCQHVLLRGCTNLLDLYRRLGVADKIRFYKEFYFLEPGGRMSVLAPGRLPPPVHFAASFLGMRCLGLADKLCVGRALRALQRERRRPDLDRITMLAWLREKRQTPRAIERFWRQVLVSAVNEDLDRMAAAHGFQVFWSGFLASAEACQMGVPAVTLGELYSPAAWGRLPTVTLHARVAVEKIVVREGSVDGILADGVELPADAVVCAVPFERVSAVVPELPIDFEGWEHSPITGIHLWFDRAVTELPYATLLDRTIQWFFNKGGGKYLQVVVSASRGMLGMARQEIVDLAVKELGEYLPAVREARLEKAHVVKEARATFSAKPGLEMRRPAAVTQVRRLFLAGDWTRTGWPATMEGAVRSGYFAAEALADSLGAPGRFLVQ